VGAAGYPVAEEAGQAGGAEVADVAVLQAGQADCCQRQCDAAEDGPSSGRAGMFFCALGPVWRLTGLPPGQAG
jgi:hypothetical protein